jgi:hypothetical protein
MKKRLLTPLLASLFIAAPLACGGDDKGGDASDSATATDPGSTSAASATDTTPTTSATSPTTTGPDQTTTAEPPTTSDPTTDPTTATTGEPVGCQAPADDADEDGDGIANASDNCRCDPNPNQLDFDGNTVGNVCDQPLRFTIADGVPPEFNKLDTTATAKSTLMCSFPVSLIILGGDLQVELDDVGQAKIFALKMNFADTPELVCDLVVVKVKLRIQQWFSDGDMPFAVGFPFAQADHDAGTVTGMTDKPHSILVTGIINVTESSNPDLAMPGENPLMMVPGAFPMGLASASTGGQASITFDDKDSIVFTQTTMTGIEIKLTGLKGTLRLKK